MPKKQPIRKSQLVYLDALEERIRRLKTKKAKYKPNDGQLPIHMSDKTIKFCASGNGAGKTTAAVMEAVWGCQGYHPVKKKNTKVPAHGAVVLDKPDKADSVWVPAMREWYDTSDWVFSKKGKANTTEVEFPNGSKLTFFSHDQDPLTFESIEIDFVIYDEPPPRSVFIALRRGTRKKGTKPWHLIIGTPLTGAWLRLEIYEPWAKGELPEADCFKMDSDVNKENINWAEQEKNFRFMTEKEQQIRRRGDFFDLEGQALAHLMDRSVHILPAQTFVWDESNPCVVAIDPHPSKAHHAVIIGADRDNRLYVLKETAQKMVPRQFARFLKEWYKGYRIIDITVDSLGKADGTGGEGFLSFIQVLNAEGVRARGTSYDDKSDEAFMARIQDALQIPEEPDNFGQYIPKLRLLSSCHGCLTDIEQVQWARDKKNDVNKPKLEISNRDFLATIKYGLATNLYYSKAKDKAYYQPVPKSYGGKGERKQLVSINDWLKD